MANSHSQPRSLRSQHPKETNSWKAMMARCYNPKNASYRYHGAKGISVCERWRLSFAAFLEDMGPAPSPEHTLDRFPDPNGNYEPGNVRWATAAEQQRNTIKVRWLTHNGQTLCIADWAKETGLPSTTISNRINRLGWSIERALTEPAQVSRTTMSRVPYRGQMLSVAELAAVRGLSPSTVRDRLDNGWTAEEAAETPSRPMRSPRRVDAKSAFPQNKSGTSFSHDGAIEKCTQGASACVETPGEVPERPNGPVSKTADDSLSSDATDT